MLIHKLDGTISQIDTLNDLYDGITLHVENILIFNINLVLNFLANKKFKVYVIGLIPKDMIPYVFDITMNNMIPVDYGHLVDIGACLHNYLFLLRNQILLYDSQIITCINTIIAYANLSKYIKKWKTAPHHLILKLYRKYD